MLRQGDCKNAFCNSFLPDDEVVIIKPPLGDPDAETNEYWCLWRTLYGLRHSPKHWYDKISAIPLKMGFRPCAHDPCLYVGFLDAGSDSNTRLDSKFSTTPIYLGLHVDDFIYFSISDEIEHKFEELLAKELSVEFMGTVEWFLGIQFTWKQHNNNELSVHLNQQGFAQHTVECRESDGR